MPIGISPSLSSSLRYAVSVSAVLAMDIIWCSSCSGHHLMQFLLWTSFDAILDMDIIWCNYCYEHHLVHLRQVHPLNAKEVYQQC